MNTARKVGLLERAMKREREAIIAALAGCDYVQIHECAAAIIDLRIWERELSRHPDQEDDE